MTKRQTSTATGTLDALLLSAFLLVAAVGAVTSASTTLLVSAFVGVPVAIVVAIEAEDVGGRLSARRLGVVIGLGAALCVPFVAGLVWLGPMGGLLSTAVVALGGRAMAARWTGSR